MAKPDPPAVREDDLAIEIDQRRGKWPFLKAMWGSDKRDRIRLIFIVDSNESGSTIGEAGGIAIVALSKKKAVRLAQFILRSAEEVPD